MVAATTPELTRNVDTNDGSLTSGPVEEPVAPHRRSRRWAVALPAVTVLLNGGMKDVPQTRGVGAYPSALEEGVRGEGP